MSAGNVDRGRPQKTGLSGSGRVIVIKIKVHMMVFRVFNLLIVVKITF